MPTTTANGASSGVAVAMAVPTTRPKTAKTARPRAVSRGTERGMARSVVGVGDRNGRGQLGHQCLTLIAGHLHSGTQKEAMGQGGDGSLLNVVGGHEVPAGPHRQCTGHPHQGQGRPR